MTTQWMAIQVVTLDISRYGDSQFDKLNQRCAKCGKPKTEPPAMRRPATVGWPGYDMSPWSHGFDPQVG